MIPDKYNVKQSARHWERSYNGQKVCCYVSDVLSMWHNRDFMCH